MDSIAFPPCERARGENDEPFRLIRRVGTIKSLNLEREIVCTQRAAPRHARTFEVQREDTRDRGITDGTIRLRASGRLGLSRAEWPERPEDV
jgi:hypothetical protein